MNIYHYNAETKEYTGSSLADPSPREPGVYLIPAHATSVEPPNNSDEAKIIIFDNDEWLIIDKPEPFVEEVDDGMEEWERLRRFNYPNIGDQLDALYHAGVFPEEMAAQIKAVKDLYPKPTEGGVE